jgi:ABC-type uncharacterized transport system ATPase subunit
LADIKAKYGQDSLHLRLAGGPKMLAGLEGVEHVLDLGHYQQVRVSGDPQTLLSELVQRTRVHHFEETQPSLHDIFIRVAGPEAARESEEV